MLNVWPNSGPMQVDQGWVGYAADHKPFQPPPGAGAIVGPHGFLGGGVPGINHNHHHMGDMCGGGYYGMGGVSQQMGAYQQMEDLWDTVEQDLLRIVAEVQMTETDNTLVRECLEELRKAAAALGPNYRVSSFGSIANGLCRHGSDLDATCYKTPTHDDEAPFTASEMQCKLLPLLRETGRFEVMEEIWGARIPIVKLRFDQSLDVDLSSNNTEPLANTELIRAYVDMDKKVQDLGILVKLWAKSAGVSGAVKGNLSAYAFTLMVIFFLQVEEDVKVPVLDTQMFSTKTYRKEQHGQWGCRLTRAELFRRFFAFYTQEFRWGTEVISVRLGTRETVNHPAFSQLSGLLQDRIHIEDPFLLNRNLNCVLRVEQEEVLYSKMLAAAQAMQMGWLPENLRSDKTAPLMGASGNSAALGGQPFVPAHFAQMPMRPAPFAAKTAAPFDPMAAPYHAAGVLPSAPLGFAAYTANGAADSYRAPADAGAGAADSAGAPAMGARPWQPNTLAFQSLSEKVSAVPTMPAEGLGEPHHGLRPETKAALRQEMMAAKGAIKTSHIAPQFGELLARHIGLSETTVLELSSMAPPVDALPITLLQGCWSL